MPTEPGQESRRRAAANQGGTARRQARAATEASERFLRESQRVARLGSYEFDIQQGTWRSSAVLDEIFGIGPGYARTVESWLAIVHADDRSALRDYLMGEVVGRGGRFDREYRIVAVDDATVRWVHGLGRVEADAEGRPAHLLGTIQDITRRKQVDAALAESEAMFRQVFEQSPIGKAMVGLDRRFLQCNRAFQRFIGRTQEELIGIDFLDLTWHEDRGVGLEEMQAIIGGSLEQAQVQKRYVRKDGQVVWAEVTIALARDAQGRPRFFLPAFQDITERKRIAEALAESERTYREIFNASSDALFIHDETGRIVDVNDRVCTLFRCRREEALRLDIALLSQGTPPYSMAEAAEHVRRAVMEGPQLFTWRSRRHDGELFWTEVALRACTIGGMMRVIAGVRDISERKAAEEQLREQRQMVAAIVETSQDWIWVVDAEGRHIFSNPAVERILGWPLETFRGMGLELMHPEDRRLAESDWPRYVEERRGWCNQVARWRHSDGSFRYLESTSVPVIDADGTFRGFRGVDRDITERRAAEEALVASEARFRNLFDQAKDAIFLADAASGLLVDANRAAELLTGRTRAAFVGLHQKFLHPAGEEERYQALFRKAMAHSGMELHQGELATASGGRVPVEISASIIVLPDGRSLAQVIFRDVSERRLAEEELRRSERRFALAISATADAIWDWDLATGRTYYSPRWYAMLGYADGAFPMTYETWWELCHPDDVAPTRTRMEAALARPGDSAFVVEFRMRHRDGSWRWIQGRGDVVERDAASRPLRVSGTSSDITQRKRAEDERDRLFALSQDLLCVASYDGYLKQVNPAWTRVLGWSAEELMAHPWLHYVHPDDRAATEEAGLRLLSGAGVHDFENRYRCKDGSYRLLSWNSSPFTDDQLIFAVVRDLTEARRNEQRLRQMEKMDAIGQLAGGVAHDFNNQLGAIMGFAEMLEKRLTDPLQRRYAGNILTATHRSADLTGQLLAFARKGQYLKVAVDLHGMIHETVAILSRSVDRRIHFQQLLKAHQAQVVGDPTQIQNALLNLGLNARDAMPEGGLLTFETGVRQLTGEEAAGALAEAAAGDYIEVLVSDTGCGMTSEVKAHLFEPFFTTKEPGKGTGMGLAAVYGTIRNHGGMISVASAEGQGTTFRILLPSRRQPAVCPAGDHPLPGLRRQGILIIDDEAMLRDLLGELLEDDGHTVFRAVNGVQGVEIYRVHRQRIDLVILDLVMPEMNGRDCFRAIKAIDPAARVLLSSGFSLNGEIQAILAEGALGFIQKPFQKEDLLRKLAELQGP